MATRTVTYPECDRAGCRRRKGVAPVKITMTTSGIVGDAYVGELCPAHIAMTKRFMNNLFKNTKAYPANPEDS